MTFRAATSISGGRARLMVAATLVVAISSLAGQITEPAARQALSAGGALSKTTLPRTPGVEALVSQGRLQILDEYGAGPDAKLLVRGTETDLAVAEVAAGSIAGRRRHDDQILLRSRTIETASGPSHLISAAGDPGRLEILQFHGPIKPEWLAELRRHAVPIAYVPHNAYIIWTKDATGLAAAPLPVQWREPYAPGDRLSPDLHSVQGPADVTVQVARAGNHERLLDEIRSRALAILMEPSRAGPVMNIRATLPAGAAEDLAARPEVVWVEPFDPVALHDERGALIAAGLLSRGRPLGPGYLSWLEANGLADLSEALVDVTDTGIDTGGTAVRHPGLAGRVAYAADFTPEGNLDDCAGHGTHVAGIIAGGAAAGAHLLDADGFLPGLGLAPTARLGASRIFNCQGQFASTVSVTDLVAHAYARGARIGNNSWGGSGGQYNTIAAEYDALVRDANQDPLDGDQGFLPVFSCGNLGPSPITIGWPASAKNVLSVGATEGYRPLTTDGCATGSGLADNADHVLSISSRGPTADGRLKPDLVAPGSHIQSLASTAGGFTGVGVCDAYYPPGQRLLNWSTGTSQAAAHVSGAAAIASVFYKRLYGADPSPAMLKALLINSARDIGNSATNPSNTSNRPNLQQGWGRVDTGALIAGQGRVAIDQTELLQATGQTVELGPIVSQDPARSVIVTLAWTDAPGTPAASAWVNDLDLIVKSGGAIYLGNAIDRGVSIPGGQADTRNNVEVVILPPGAATLSVTVEAANIAADGVPAVEGETDQDFALYITNARLATGAGSVEFVQPQAVCGGEVSLFLSDLGLRGFGRAAVEVASGGDLERVVLDERAAATGVFSGSIDVAAGPAIAGDGVLQSADSQTITALYLDLDPGTGLATRRTDAILARCSPPTITDAAVTRVGDAEATIRWRTDRPADSTVVYGLGSARTLTLTDAKLVTEHEVRLPGLSGCSFYTAAIASTDSSGLAASGAAPLSFSTGVGSRGRRVLFRDDMEALGSRWTHSAAAPSGAAAVDEWELGFPAVGPPGPFSGQRAWGTDLDGMYDVGLDAALVSPPVDLTAAVGPQLAFMHYYAISGGRSPTSENDGAWVEISSDDGLTWAPLDPAGGYPDLVDADNPHLPAASGVYAGTLFAWEEATFDLSNYAGNVVRFRFRMWQDAGENNPRSTGWYIDDVEVTAQGSCHRGSVRLDADSYGCSSRVTVFASDSDVNINPSSPDTLRVNASSSIDQRELLLTETEAGSGEFRAMVDLRSAAGPGALAVVEGESILFRYSDQNTGDGSPATASASALVSDCAPPPPPSGVVARSDGSGRVLVAWNPIDPLLAPDLLGYRVHYDNDASGPTYVGTGAFQGASPVQVELATTSLALTLLQPCARQFLTITSFDRLGNESPFSPESIAVPEGSAPCALGRIAVSPAAPGCRDTLAITVLDQNADLNPGSAGSLTVVATGGTGGDTLTVTLQETSAASGIFTGPLVLAPLPQPGSLVVVEGETITARYDDADDGHGQARSTTGTVTVSDCTGPVISGISLTERAATRATVRWTTDEPATSTVQYGLDPSLGLTVYNPALTTQHAVLIAGLNTCAPAFFAIASTDARGNHSAAPGTGPPMRFGSYRETTAYFDDLESGAAGWTHMALAGPGDEWELGAPSGGVAGAPPSAYSGTAVWGTDLDGAYENGADIVLVSPTLDLTRVETATLTFRHWFDIFTSGAPNGFDDGAFLEASADGGATWSYITPLGDYPDRISGTPYLPFGSRAYAGYSAGWVEAAFPLDSFAGKLVKVRFHLLEDPGEISSNSHAGWYIDDVKLTVAAACHEGRIDLDRPVYGCNGATARVRVADIDLDTGAQTLDSTIVRVFSDAEAAGESMTLVETALSSGIFEGEIPISKVDAAGTLRAQQDDTIRALYEDADDGTGASSPITATARVFDCTPPAISDVQLLEQLPGSFRLRWTTSEPADSTVLFGTAPSLGSLLHVPGLRTSHDVTVSGLPSCTRHFFTVQSTDAAGNLIREDAAAPLRTVVTTGDIVLASERFDSGAPGWHHIGQGNTWLLGSNGMATTSAAGPYGRSGEGINSDFVLVSPSFNLAGVERPALALVHSFGFATSFLGGDGGWVEAWDGIRWVKLAPDGGYPGFLDAEAARTGQPVPGYSGVSAGWITDRFDLTPIAAALEPRGLETSRVRFRVFVEGGVGATGLGWRIDDVSVSGSAACSQGRLGFERDRVTCASGSVDLTLNDRDLDVSSQTLEQTVVTVVSTGDPSPLQVTLVETTPAGGSFRGSVPLSAAPAPGSLGAAPGDRLTATYLDADDGSGASRQTHAEIPVAGCAPPAISDISVGSSGDKMILRWRTDRPSTSEATLEPASGARIEAADHRLVTGHQLLVGNASACSTYSVTLASTDADGLRGQAGGPGTNLLVETSDRSILFSDNMEGPDPGWTTAGFRIEWQRGVPLDGPLSAFSGQRVYGTDLAGDYDGGTNSTLITPPIDLRGVSTARLTFWHWYDIYANSPPNSTDDSAWVEVIRSSGGPPVYLQPVGGYPDTTDEEGGAPLPEGTAVYAGQSNDWEHATFDLTPFAGDVVRLRFRLWNDVVELIINGFTGAGWYLDDVEVASPRFCHPAPSIAPTMLGTILQGESASGVVVSGSGFRAGAAVTLGTGVAVTGLTVDSPSQIRLDLAVDPRAVLGPRDLTIVNPDGQAALQVAALQIGFSPRRADLDGSGRIDGSDLLALAIAFASVEGEQAYSLAADLNADGAVDGLDLAMLAASFGTSF